MKSTFDVCKELARGNVKVIINEALLKIFLKVTSATKR